MLKNRGAPSMGVVQGELKIEGEGVDSSRIDG